MDEKVAVKKITGNKGKILLSVTKARRKNYGKQKILSRNTDNGIGIRNDGCRFCLWAGYCP